MRKRPSNQIKIEFSHDVINFKKKHQLILPPDQMLKPIWSETDLAVKKWPDHTRQRVSCGVGEVRTGCHKEISLYFNQPGDISLISQYYELLSKRRK
jgi:hypothetical protein